MNEYERLRELWEALDCAGDPCAQIVKEQMEAAKPASEADRRIEELVENLEIADLDDDDGDEK